MEARMGFVGMERWFLKLFSEVRMPESRRQRVAVMAPVGTREEAANFLRIISRQKFRKFDVLLIYPNGCEPANTKRRGVILAFERLQLGTSGCFFAGQALLYSLGYKVIVAADADAAPSSQRLVGSLVRMAEKGGGIAVVRSALPGREPEDDYFVINQYGAYHRRAIQKAGFLTPYMRRGAEDYDMASRAKRLGLLGICNEGFVRHPRAGWTIYHRMANGKKFYPYVNGLLRAFLFRGERAKYFAWYCYYRYFAAAFGEQALTSAIALSPRMAIMKNCEGSGKVKAEGGSEGESSRASKALRSLIAIIPLALFGKANVLGGAVSYSGSRANLFCRALLAVPCLLFFAGEALSGILSWEKERGKVIYPVYPKGAKEAGEIYARMLEKGRL